MSGAEAARRQAEAALWRDLGAYPGKPGTSVIEGLAAIAAPAAVPARSPEPGALTPERRSLAMARARQAAPHFARAVSQGDARMVQRVRDGLDEHEFAALAVVLAAAADGAALLRLARTDDDAMPGHVTVTRARKESP